MLSIELLHHVVDYAKGGYNLHYHETYTLGIMLDIARQLEESKRGDRTKQLASVLGSFQR